MSKPTRNRKNEYRSLYVRITENPDFQELSIEAQRLFFFLKISPECGPVGCFKFYPVTFMKRLYLGQCDEETGIPNPDVVETFKDSLGELIAFGWVEREDDHLRIVNSMRFEPNFNPLKDEKHMKCLISTLEDIKHTDLAQRLLEENDIPVPNGWGPDVFDEGPCEDPCQGSTKGLTKGPSSTETERETETHTAEAAPEEEELLSSYEENESHEFINRMLDHWKELLLSSGSKGPFFNKRYPELEMSADAGDEMWSTHHDVFQSLASELVPTGRTPETFVCWCFEQFTQSGNEGMKYTNKGDLSKAPGIGLPAISNLLESHEWLVTTFVNNPQYRPERFTDKVVNHA